MSEYRFTDGNLIVLYAVHRGKSAADGGLPDYIVERVKLGIETYGIVIRSKQMMVQGGADEKIIAIDSDSQNMAQTIDRIYGMVKSKPNPPFIYFVGSVWLHDIFNSTVVSKLKGYKVQFYGALDHRPVDEVEHEKAIDVPKRGVEYYKQQAKNKAVDVLLNIIFPD
jgi:hypothetical protein